MMTPRQIELVQSSFGKVISIADKAAALFYGRLFEIAPDVRPLFRTDATEQGRKLMLTLATLVHDIDNLERFVPAAAHLARRHVGYGAREEHYAAVGDALLWTLQQGLGAAFTPEVKAAWVVAYDALSGVMIDAARKVAA